MKTDKNQDVAKAKSEKSGSQIDRVILGKSEAKILDKWVQDFNEQAEGLVKVSKADLINYLIANHAPKLTSEEVQEISTRYYDETRWLGWSVTKMKAAKKKGVVLLFEDLMKFRDQLLGKVATLGKKKKAQSILDASPDISKTLETPDTNSENI